MEAQPSTLTQYQVNAFAMGPFSGNPAAVCVTPEPLAEHVMQAIATQNNLAETAFCVLPKPAEPALGTTAPQPLSLRWFTPLHEVRLCGHATLASAFVLAEHYGQGNDFTFQTQSGLLHATRKQDGSFEIDLPARPSPEAPELLRLAVDRALGNAVSQWVGAGPYLLAILDAAASVKGCAVDMTQVAQLPKPLIISARGEGDADFVSRFFCPHSGVPEDPVTGSAHCQLVPYWAEQLGKGRLVARQLSHRGGRLECTLVQANQEQRVRLRGNVELYSKAETHVPPL